MRRKLTVIVQLCGPGDQHEEEKRCKAKSHAKQLCVTETQKQERKKTERKRIKPSDITVMQWQNQVRHVLARSLYTNITDDNLLLDAAETTGSSSEGDCIASRHSDLSAAHHSHGFSLEQIHFCITCEGEHMRGRPLPPPPHPGSRVSAVHSTNTRKRKLNEYPPLCVVL